MLHYFDTVLDGHFTNYMSILDVALADDGSFSQHKASNPVSYRDQWLEVPNLT